MPGGMGDIGNLPTEDIVNMLNRSDLDTGLDTDLILTTAKKIETILDIPSRSFAARNKDIGV
jgi:hydroxymethylglutaryl-CoA lyase